MNDMIEKVLRLIMIIASTLASITTIIKNLRTQHKPKH